MAEAPCRSARLQPPLPLTSGSNRRSRPSHRAPLIEQIPVIPSPSSGSHRSLAGAHDLAASPEFHAETLDPHGELSPLSNLVRPIWIRRVELTHLTEQVPTDLDRPDPLKSDGSSRCSNRTGINESELAMCRARICSVSN
jgi:hypothetical protein